MNGKNCNINVVVNVDILFYIITINDLIINIGVKNIFFFVKIQVIQFILMNYKTR